MKSKLQNLHHSVLSSRTPNKRTIEITNLTNPGEIHDDQNPFLRKNCQKESKQHNSNMLFKKTEVSLLIFDEIDRIVELQASFLNRKLINKKIEISATNYPPVNDLDSFAKPKMSQLILDFATIRNENKQKLQFQPEILMEKQKSSKSRKTNRQLSQNNLSSQFLPENFQNSFQYNFINLLIKRKNVSKNENIIKDDEQFFTDLTQRRVNNRQSTEILPIIKRPIIIIPIVSKKTLINFQDVIFPLKNLYLKMGINGLVSVPSKFKNQRNSLLIPPQIRLIKKLRSQKTKKTKIGKY